MLWSFSTDIPGCSIWPRRCKKNFSLVHASFSRWLEVLKFFYNSLTTLLERTSFGVPRIIYVGLPHSSTDSFVLCTQVNYFKELPSVSFNFFWSHRIADLFGNIQPQFSEEDDQICYLFELTLYELRRNHRNSLWAFSFYQKTLISAVHPEKTFCIDSPMIIFLTNPSIQIFF